MICNFGQQKNDRPHVLIIYLLFAVLFEETNKIFVYWFVRMARRARAKAETSAAAVLSKQASAVHQCYPG